MVGKAPSEGTKVTLGDNAPIQREGAGAVAPDSLAAQSSTFTSTNRNINTNTDTDTASSSAPHVTPREAQSSNQRSSNSNNAAAPTYVNNQFARDAAGPHGKNLTEDPDMTGRPGAFNVEVGGDQDPARVAERNLLLKQTRGAPGTGEREVGVTGAKTGEQPYEVLGSETSA